MTTDYEIVWCGAARDYLNARAETLRAAPPLKHERIPRFDVRRPRRRRTDEVLDVLTHTWLSMSELTALTKLSAYQVRTQLAVLTTERKVERCFIAADRTRYAHYRLAQNRVP